MKRTVAKASLQTALNLLFFTVIGTTLLAFTYRHTRDDIAHSEEQARMGLISQIYRTAADRRQRHRPRYAGPQAR